MNENLSINEYKTYTMSISTGTPYPVAGSRGVYFDELWSIQSKISSKALILLIGFMSSVNEFNQVLKTREEMCKAIGIKHNRSRISKLITELVDAEAICLFNKVVTVNPYLCLPVCSPRLKSAQQNSWDVLVRYL